MPRRQKMRKLMKRDAELDAYEQKINELNTRLDEYVHALDVKGREIMKDVDNQMEMLLLRTSKSVLKMKVNDFLALNLNSCNDNAPKAAAELLKPTSSHASKSSDEGYRSENFRNTETQPRAQNLKRELRVGRSLRPRVPSCNRSSSASRARQYGAIHKLTPYDSSVQPSRGKLRCPKAKRSLSADGIPLRSPAVTFLRLQKPGELAISARGSPLLLQARPDACPSVNIPVDNGVISIRSKEIADMNGEILKPIKPETLDEIKVLCDNLNKVLTIANRMQ